MFSYDIIERRMVLCSSPAPGRHGRGWYRRWCGYLRGPVAQFFSWISGEDGLEFGKFAAGNFLPAKTEMHGTAISIINKALKHRNFHVISQRRVPVNKGALLDASIGAQLDMHQWVFVPDDEELTAADRPGGLRHSAGNGGKAFTREDLAGFYPVSLSSKTQVLKGQLVGGCSVLP